MKRKVNKSLYADIEINTVIIKSENFGFPQSSGYEIQINRKPFIRQPGIAFKFISYSYFHFDNFILTYDYTESVQYIFKQ